MNQTNWTAIIGVLAAAIISVIQVFHGSAIGDLEDGTMHRDTIQTHVDNIEDWQKAQDRRLNNLESRHDIHEHFELEIEEKVQ